MSKWAWDGFVHKMRMRLGGGIALLAASFGLAAVAAAGVVVSPSRDNHNKSGHGETTGGCHTSPGHTPASTLAAQPGGGLQLPGDCVVGCGGGGVQQGHHSPLPALGWKTAEKHRPQTWP